MALTKYKLGNLISLCERRNSELQYGISDVKGISIQKVFIETKADMTNVSLRPYYLVQPDDFAYVTVTSRNGEKITIAHNNSKNTYIVSSSYVVFRVSRKDILLSDYLFMYFNRPEFDRYARFNSWGSARETFSWDEMCDIDIDLPPIGVQQKYVDVYNSMLANQQNYDRGLDDLKEACELLLEKFKRGTLRVALGNLITEVDVRNTNGAITSVQGVNKVKHFMPSVASSTDVLKYKIVSEKQFACNLMHVGRDGAIPIAMNTGSDIIVSPAYTVFEINNDQVLPEFVLMWLSRRETDRLAWFMSDTNVRSGMEKSRFYEIEIPVPSMTEQKAVVELFQALDLRMNISDHIKECLNDMCPILIRGSLEEASA